MKFYHKIWFMVLMLFIFPPAFLFSFLTHPEITKKTKMIVGALFIVAVCLAGMFGTKPTNEQSNKPSVQMVEKAEKKNEVSYFVLSERILQEYFTKKSHTVGMGVPEVDARFMTYKDWDIDETMKVSQGTFYLGGNDKVEHSYTIRWRKKNNQVLRVEINGQKVYYDEEAQWATMDDDKKK